MSYKVIVGEKHSSWPEKPTSNINIAGSSSEAEGGGSNPDWNQNDPDGEGYIANRPCYIDGIQYSEFFSRTCSFVDNEGVKISTDQTFELVLGLEYKVVFDGIESVLVCKDLNEGRNPTIPYIGNAKAFSAEDTGEDFCLVVAETPMIISYVEGDNHQIALGSYSVVYKELDHNFLPKASDTMPGITLAPFRVIYRDVAYTQDEIMALHNSISGLPASILFIAYSNIKGAIYEQIKDVKYGNRYDDNLISHKCGIITKMDGSELEYLASEDGTVTFNIGNGIEKYPNIVNCKELYSTKLNLNFKSSDGVSSITIEGKSTGLYGDTKKKLYTNTVFSGNLIIDGALQSKDLIIKKLDINNNIVGYAVIKINKEDGNLVLSNHNVGIFMPDKTRKIFLDEDKEFILASSTEGSTKKFKVTVDDSGTLTTTEIV